MGVGLCLQCLGTNSTLTTVLPRSPIYMGARGSTVVKVLCYKSKGHWFDPSWCKWNFSLT